MGGVKAVFLDVDGTYAHHGVPPAAHVEAVRALRAGGHLVFLCTGRPRSMLSDRLLAPGFDGIVGTAGGYVEIGGDVIDDRRFAPETAARIVEVLDAHDVAYLLEAPDRIVGPPGVAARLERILGGLFPSDGDAGDGLDILDTLYMPDDRSGIAFAKVACFGSPVPVDALAVEIGDGVGAIVSSFEGVAGAAGELFQSGVHKAVGIRTALAHLGLDRADVIAVGDGLNDIEMLEYAGIGVAVEGGRPEALAVADLVVPGPDRAGLVTAFERLGLLD